jgi:hypothetical protein
LDIGEQFKIQATWHCSNSDIQGVGMGWEYMLGWEYKVLQNIDGKTQPKRPHGKQRRIYLNTF